MKEVLEREDLQLLSVLYHCKLNSFGFGGVGWTPWPLGNCDHSALLTTFTSDAFGIHLLIIKALLLPLKRKRVIWVEWPL